MSKNIIPTSCPICGAILVMPMRNQWDVENEKYEIWECEGNPMHMFKATYSLEKFEYLEPKEINKKEIDT